MLSADLSGANMSIDATNDLNMSAGNAFSADFQTLRFEGTSDTTTFVGLFMEAADNNEADIDLEASNEFSYSELWMDVDSDGDDADAMLETGAWGDNWSAYSELSLESEATNDGGAEDAKAEFDLEAYVDGPGTWTDVHMMADADSSEAELHIHLTHNDVANHTVLIDMHADHDTATLRFEANTAAFHADMDVHGSLDVDDATALNSTLDVDGVTTLNDSLDVDGNAAFHGNTQTGGSANIDGDLTVDGDSDLDDTDVDGTLDVSGNTDIDGTLDVEGATNMQSTLTVADDTDLNAELDVDGDTHLDTTDIDGSLNVEDMAQFQANVAIDDST